MQNFRVVFVGAVALLVGGCRFVLEGLRRPAGPSGADPGPPTALDLAGLPSSADLAGIPLPPGASDLGAAPDQGRASDLASSGTTPLAFDITCPRGAVYFDSFETDPATRWDPVVGSWSWSP